MPRFDGSAILPRGRFFLLPRNEWTTEATECEPPVPLLPFWLFCISHDINSLNLTQCDGGTDLTSGEVVHGVQSFYRGKNAPSEPCQLELPQEW
jgi:hypothetical protein